MSEQSDTPRTDKFTSTWDFHDEPFEAAEHARTLERELTAARAEIAEWRILNGWGGTPEIINDFIKGQQTRIHYAQDLETELAAVTEQRDGLRSGIDYASDQLSKVTEQRDRLAEAGKDLLKNLYNINDDGGKIATIRRMKEALQSLTLNKL
jgi:hypothetical protein